MEPPLFDSLPEVVTMEPMTTAGSYRVVLSEANAHTQSATFTVDGGGPSGVPTASPYWDIFWRWPGDAASVRHVVAQVLAFHDDHQGGA